MDYIQERRVWILFIYTNIGMKSQNGITMISLIIYVTSFLVIAGIVAGLTIFFYRNHSLINTENYSSAEFNKLNMYLSKESEESGNRIVYDHSDIETEEGSKINVLQNNSTDNDIVYIEFSNGDRITLDKSENLLYYNKICLCEDVQDLKANIDYSTGKEVLSIKVDFTNKSYSSKYTMK